jgi:tetratricopeptide (TPR) repeat protein
VQKAQERGASREQNFAQAKAAAEKALSLDDRVVQAHNALAEYAFHYAWDWEAEDRHMQRALAVDPNYFLALSHYGNHETARNRLESGLAAHLKVKSLNPLSGVGQIALTLTLLDRHDEAIRVARENLAEHPNSGRARFGLGYALFHGGQREEGLRMLEDAVARLKEDILVNANLGWAYGRAGQKDKALAIFKRIEAAQVGGGRERSLVLLAFIAAGLDDRDRVMALLERAYAERDPGMPFIGAWPAFRPLHGDPRFRALLGKMKLDTYFPEPPAK